MDKAGKQAIETSSLHLNKDHDSSPRKDRLKRDEWSEGAVSSLLEAYEAKWVLRNRAKLKGHDWEDVARYVSSRADSTKSPKTQTQCKNKIESMKKRYRAESAAASDDVGSSWPLFPRLDLLLRGSGGGVAAAAVPSAGDDRRLMVIEQMPIVKPPSAPSKFQTANMPVPVPVLVSETDPAPVQAQNSIGDSIGVYRENKKQGGMDAKESDHQLSGKMEMETDCSTPALYSNDKGEFRSNDHKTVITDGNGKKRRRKEQHWEIVESIRWLAKVVMRSEQTRIDTTRELEKMRTDAEIKRCEIDLKRTEIIANTQLEIARLFATNLGKGVDPSLRIGRS